jgi:hypothetical protein
MVNKSEVGCGVSEGRDKPQPLLSHAGSRRVALSPTLFWAIERGKKRKSGRCWSKETLSLFLVFPPGARGM